MHDQMNTVNYERTAALAEKIPPYPKACWYNASTTILRLRLKRYFFVDGYVVLSQWALPIEHGWMEYDDHEGTHILDTSLFMNDTKEALLAHTYFPGYRLDYPTLQKYGTAKIVERLIAFRREHAESYMQCVEDANVSVFGPEFKKLFRNRE
jgi:hypothetical protein